MNKQDSFVNLLTSLNTSDDKRTATNFRIGEREVLTRHELEALYFGDGLARIIVDGLPDEMLRKGWTIEIPEDTDKAIQDALHKGDRSLGFEKKLMEALRYAELYGGGTLLLGVRDGTSDPAEPVNVEAISKIEYVVPLSPYQIQVQEIGRDPFSHYFEQPLFYTLSEGAARSGMKVHASRVLHFNGNPIPRNAAENFNQDKVGFGVPTLQLAYGPLMNLVTSFDSMATMVHEYNQAVFQIEGLMQLLMEGEDGVATVHKRLRLMQMSRSIANALILQEGESFETKSLDMRGLADVMDKFMLHLSAVTRRPVTKLMGQSPAGFSATGESDEQNWIEYVSSQQEAKLRDPLERFYSYRLRAMQKEPVFSLEFTPLKQMSEKETAELRKLNADTDNIYLTHSVVFPEEIAKSRFGGEEYGDDIQLENDSRLVTTSLESDYTEEVSSGPEQEQYDSAKLVAIVSGVKDGTIPAESAIEILSVAFPSLSRDSISAMVLPAANSASGTVGATEGTETSGDDIPLEDDATLPADAMSAKEVAAKLGFAGSQSVTRLWKQGKIRAWKLGGRYLVSESEVQKAILQGTPAGSDNLGTTIDPTYSTDSD